MSEINLRVAMIIIHDLDCFVSLYINSKRKWARFDMRGKFLDQTEAADITDEWEILCTPC